ncbi:tail fiber/spike domain-containing protein [Escherichia coli]
MATQPTNLPVPSESPRDLKFNAGKIDEFVTSAELKYTDRFGGQHYTIEGLRWLAQQTIAAFGYVTIDSFEDGATLTLPNEVLRLEATGEYYRWDGAFPLGGKVVPPGSTPVTTGGVGIGAWLSVGDATLRGQLSSPEGATIVYNGAETVAAQLNKLLGEQTNIFYLDNEGAVGNSSTNGGGADDSAAFESAFAKVKAAGGGIVYGTPGKSYRMTRTAFYSSNIIIDMRGSRVYWGCPSTAPEASFWLPETFQMANDTDYVENVIIRNVVIASPPNLGNAIGVMKARNILIEDIHTESLWLHTVDGCGAKNMVIRRVRAEFASELSHLQVDCAVGERSVTGADASGNYMYTANDPTGTANWAVCDSVWIEDCYLANNLYSGISVHNYAGARVFIRNNVILNNILAGINSDTNGGYYRLLWIEGNYISGSRNYELNLAGDHRHLVLKSNILVSSNRTVDSDAGVSGSGLISMRAAATDTTRRNYAIIDGNLFMGRDKAITIQNYQNLRYTNNIHNAMGNATYGSVTSVATWAVALSGCEPVICSDNSFYDCTLDTCILVNNYLGSPALVSGQICNNSFRGVGAMIKVVSANRMLLSGNTGTPQAEAPVGIFLSSVGTLSTVSDNIVSMSGAVPAIQANSCSGLYLSGNSIGSTTTSGKGIVALDCPDVRTSTNNIRSVTNAIEAQGTSVMTCHEPFIPAANIVKTGTGSITYNTFTTATK